MASAATIVMAWAFYELLTSTSAGLALMARLLRVGEARCTASRLSARFSFSPKR